MPLSTSRPQGPTYLANTTLPVIASRNPPSSSWRQGYSRYLTQTAGAAKDKRVDRADQHYLPIYSRNRARARHKTGRHWSDHCYDREPFMSLPTRSLSTRGLAGTSSHGASSSAGPSPALVARIEEKRAELDSLKQLRDLSADVATQMEALQQQLSTLNDGTEGAQAPLVDFAALMLTNHPRSYRHGHWQLA